MLLTNSAKNAGAKAPATLLPPPFLWSCPKKREPGCAWRQSAASRRESSSVTWSSRVVNDSCHQNRALLPLVAALTARIIHPSVPRSGALPPHAVWPRAKRSKRTVGDAINSFTLQDDLFLPFRGPLGRAMHPNAVWLESEGFLFDKTKRNPSERKCRGFRPCNCFIRACALIILPRGPWAALCHRPLAGLQRRLAMPPGVARGLRARFGPGTQRGRRHRGRPPAASMAQMSGMSRTVRRRTASAPRSLHAMTSHLSTHPAISAPAPPVAAKYTAPWARIASATGWERGPLPIIPLSPRAMSFGA